MMKVDGKNIEDVAITNLLQELMANTGPTPTLTVNILRYWSRKKIQRFALHLIGEQHTSDDAADQSKVFGKTCRRCGGMPRHDQHSGGHDVICQSCGAHGVIDHETENEAWLAWAKFNSAASSDLPWSVFHPDADDAGLRRPLARERGSMKNENNSGQGVPSSDLLAAGFAKFWRAKWPHQTRYVKTLEKSLHYVHCREAFYAGARAANTMITPDTNGT